MKILCRCEQPVRLNKLSYCSSPHQLQYCSNTTRRDFDPVQWCGVDIALCYIRQNSKGAHDNRNPITGSKQINFRDVITEKPWFTCFSLLSDFYRSTCARTQRRTTQTSSYFQNIHKRRKRWLTLILQTSALFVVFCLPHTMSLRHFRFIRFFFSFCICAAVKTEINQINVPENIGLWGRNIGVFIKVHMIKPIRLCFFMIT